MTETIENESWFVIVDPNIPGWYVFQHGNTKSFHYFPNQTAHSHSCFFGEVFTIEYEEIPGGGEITMSHSSEPDPWAASISVPGKIMAEFVRRFVK